MVFENGPVNQIDPDSVEKTRAPVSDQSQGVQLATSQALAEIDGLDIHFVHVRSKHENALPPIVTHGGQASDAFHLVIPSMPGYGFSQRPTTTGWGPDRIAKAWPAGHPHHHGRGHPAGRRGGCGHRKPAPAGVVSRGEGHLRAAGHALQAHRLRRHDG
ncbi:epoxide hydrolase N-terminal domain-containing protein [Lentzea sp. HUAS TT2]|uniref:epoxide hydrolase N-terminal domain-containing protein n=1 Tax=Lentzea sp. HUAS TT2 TaxID=3447454 RepID=UPI003F6F6496